MVNYFADGVCSDSDEPMMNGTPPIAKVRWTVHLANTTVHRYSLPGLQGGKMCGQFFPLVLDPS